MSSDIAIQLSGAVTILLAFALAQFKVVVTSAVIYLLLNLAGSLLLLASAITNAQWGFVLMESAWALISLWGLIGRQRGASAQS
jgi:hypothetical protein